MIKTISQDTRQHILSTGYQLIALKGFSAVGLAEILQQANVPKGSFYHYFPSKDKFGQTLIDDYFRHYLDRLDTLFQDNTITARTRLLNYWQEWLTTQKTCCLHQRCLVVKLSAEVADLSDSMRLALLSGYQKVIMRIADCIKAGQQDSSLPSQIEPNNQAQILYYLWLGASLVNKLSLDDQPLEAAMQQTLTLLYTDNHLYTDNPVSGLIRS